MPKLNIQKRIASLCRKLIIEATKMPFVVGECEEVDLQETFTQNLNPSWVSSLKFRIISVQKIVNEDIRTGSVNINHAPNPVRFIVNSISIHVLEQMLVKAGAYSNIQQLRVSGAALALRDHVKDIDLNI